MYDCGRGRVFRSVENSHWRGNGRSTWWYRNAGNCAASEGETDFLKRRKGPWNNIMRVGTIFLDHTMLR